MNLNKTLLLPAVAAICTLLAASCQDDVSPIGGSIVNNEVTINVDSTIFKLPAKSIYSDVINARSDTNQIGKLDIPEYGSLSADYVTQMLAASSLNVADSITPEHVDSTKLVIRIPRKKIIGDTLAPQQLTVYRLTKPLPSSLTSDFNPDGYYNASEPVNSKNYTLSGLNLSDSAFKKATTVTVNVDLPREWGRDAFRAYRKNADIFQWPSTFCKEYPGFYIKSTFGKGAMANVDITKVMIYYHYLVERNVVENDISVKKLVTIKDSVALFSSGPEVLSSSLFKFTPSQNLESLIGRGHCIISAPLGYTIDLTFPAEELLNQYWAVDHNLSVINNLTLTLPASSVANSYGLVPPPNLLLIKKSEVKSFFAEGKIPDNTSSFRGTYSSANGRYEFASMRKYIVDLLTKKDNILPEDVDFTLIPVNISSEIQTNSDGSKTIHITSCTPYLERPAMAEIFTDRAGIVFTYTSQLIK